MSDDPTKINWSQLDDLTLQDEATPLSTDNIPLYRDNTTGVLYASITNILALLDDPTAPVAGGLLALDDLTADVDGEATSFQLSVTPAGVGNLIVNLGNMTLVNTAALTAYTLTDDILTLAFAPASGTPLIVRILSEPYTMLSTQAGQDLTSILIWKGTSAEYAALAGSYDSNTLYLVT